MAVYQSNVSEMLGAAQADRALRRSGKIPDEIEAFTCCRLRLRQVRITFGECVGSPSIVIKISGGTDEPGYFGRSVATDERRIEVVVGTTHRRRFRLDRRRKGQAHRIDPAEIRPDARRGAAGSRPRSEEHTSELQS